MKRIPPYYFSAWRGRSNAGRFGRRGAADNGERAFGTAAEECLTPAGLWGRQDILSEQSLSVKIMSIQIGFLSLRSINPDQLVRYVRLDL
jgi:hypothetical protein